MSDNLKKVWGYLQKVGYSVPEYNQFEKDMENEDNLKKVYGSLQKVGYEVPEYGKFKTDMGSIRSQGEGPAIEQPATPVVSSSVKNKEPESSFEPKEDWGKVARDSLSRGVKKPVDVSTAANNEDGGLPRGHKMIDGQEYIVGFGPAFAQGADQLYQGGKGLVGEAANLVTGSSMDERSALATLSSKTNANEELGNEDWFLKRWQSEFQGWDAKSDKEKKALRRDYMADYQHRLQQLTSDLVGQEYTASNGKTKKYGIRDAYDIAKKQLADEQRILEALKESRGDVHEAANALSEAVANPSWGDKIIDEVNQKNAEYLPTKGFAAYMGNLAPQMIPNAAAIGLMATGNPIAGNVIGKIGMGALTASTAGQSMAEASANGATPWQTASIGLADSAIEYLSELIPFSTYTGKLAKLSKRQLSKELAQALDTPAGREELKNLYLKANKDLGSKLFSKEFGKMYVSDVAAEGLSEFVAEGLETVTPMIYQSPEEYPVLAEVLNNGLEGMKGGVAMGAFLGAASSTAVNKKRDAIRKANDKVTLAMVDTKGDGNQRICEVIGNAGEDQYLVFDGEEEIAVDKNSVTEPINYTYDEFKAGEINYKVDQSFDNGYNTTDPTVMAQKTKEYEIRRKKAAKALGMTEDEVENLNPRLLVELRDSDGLTRKQYNAALGFFRAQAAFNGMISEAQDRIESETNKVRKQVETRVNPTTGMIHPITLRPIGTEAGQQVYVVRGNVAYTEDGQIDKVNSDQDLWIIDAEGQQPRAIGLAEIESVSPAINPQQEIDEATDAIGNRIANEKEAAMTGKVEMPAGQAYTLEDGRNGVIVNQDEQNIYVAVQNEKGEIEQVAVPVATVQEAADAVGYAEAEKRINDEDAIEEEAEAHPVYDINERVTLTLEDGTPATATIIPSDSDPDVYDVILDERPESGDKIRQMTKQQLDESVVVRNNVEVQPVTKAEERTTSEAPVQESAQVVVEEPQPTVEDTTPKDFRGNALPLNEDGSVRQSELFNNDPEAWAKWNDEKHADNGANSAKYIAAAEKNAQTQLDQMRTAYDEEMDFDKRDAMEAEMKALEGKINTYKTIAENYRTGEGQLFSRVDGATKPRNAVYTDVANAAVGMTRKYGNKVQFITSIENLGKLEASEKNGALQVIQSGQQVRGWYNPASGEAYIYLPDVESVEALNKVVTHEVLTHKGLRELMGEEAYKKYCEEVYRKVMTPAQRHFFYDVYNEGRLDEAAAGDEFLAHMAQATDLTAEQEKSLWGKIADKVKSVFKGDETIDFGTDDDFIAKLLKTSYANTIRDVNLEESYKAMKDYVAKYNGDAEDRKDEKKTAEEPQDAETKVVSGSEESRMSKITGEEDSIRFSKEDLGTPFYQFKGDAKGAIEFLKARKEGQAVAALHHRDIGDIDLVWGKEGTGDSDGYGLAKLIKYHPEVLDNLQEILDNSTIVKRGENRIKLDSPKYATTVSLNWYGADKKWLLTSYEKKNSVLDNTMNTGETISGKRNDTPTPQNTVSESKDTNSQEENNTLLSKIDNVDRAIAMTTGRDVNEARQERIQKEYEKNQKIASLAKDENISEETAKGLIDRGMNMNGGIAMSQEASDLKDATGYLTPEETGYGFIPEDIRFSHGMFDEWVAIHKTLNQAKKSYIRAISAFNDRVLADEAIKDIVSTAKYPKLDKMGPLRENVEYVFTFDLDLTCPRTFQYAYISSEIEKRMGRPLKTIEAQQLMELMRAYVQEIPCTYCYCENKRQDMKNYYISWTEARNRVFAAKTRKEAEDAMYKDGSGKMTDTAKNKVLPRWIKLAKQGAYNPTIEQLYKDHEDARNAVLTWLDDNIPIDKKSLSLSDEKMAEKVMRGMGVQNKDAGKVVEEFVSEWKWYKIEGKTIPGYTQAEAKPTLEDALTIWREMTSYAKSATSAKLSARYLPYVGNLMNVSEKDKNHINAIGGLRMHSSNDFRIDYVIDYFQLIADMDANRWKGHCYTKSELFARLFGKTGYRINMSLAAYGGENGTPVTMNELEGMNWEAAKALRNENCGTMFMAVNDAQLQWALDQDWIDMIIPFHASGLRKEYWYDMRAWDNYQAKQNETEYKTEQKKEVLRERGIEFPEKANKDAIAAIFEEKVEYPHVYTKRGETISQKAPHFLPGEDVVYDKDGNEIPLPAHDNSTEKYLELCRQYMVNPRFYNVEGITYNGKPVNITEHPGYIKLIKETAATDTPQGLVKFNLDQPSERTDGLSPIDYALNELKAHAERGGWDNKKVDPHNIINEFLREYVRYAEVTGEDRPLKYLTPRARMTYDYIQRGTFEHSNTDVPYHPSTQTDAEFERALQAENEREAKGAENLTKEDFRYSKTYHGSGADFKEFDTKFMSTGEGNKAYGWGTYVTTNEQTGRRYAEVSSATPTGAAKADASAKDIVAAQIYDIMDKDPLKTFDEAKEELLATEDSRYTKDDVDTFKESDLGKYGPRHLYEVEIPDDNGFNYLHWDEPMTMKQAKAIQDEIVKQYGNELKETYGDDYMREIKSVIGYGTEGSHVEGGLNYLLGNMMDYSTGIDRGAERNSKLLSDAGIVGMEVAVDRRNGSRYAGSNYVIYDTKDAQITTHTRFSKANANQAMSSKEAQNRKPSKLNDEQWDMVRTENFKGWFGDWEFAERAKRIKNIAAEPLVKMPEGVLPIDVFRGLRKGKNVHDGTEVTFFVSAYRKIAKDGELSEKIIATLPNIFDYSILAYYGPDSLGGNLRPDGTVHKAHPNTEEVRNYVGKVNVEGRIYYVRFTVNMQKNNNGVHSYFATDIDIYKTSSEVSLSDSNLLGARVTENGTVADTKLEKFFNIANKSSKVVDENGEPLVVYHGTQWDPYGEKDGDAVFKSGWFTGLQNRAKGFGKPVGAFLNIKNPIRVSEVEGEFPPLPEGFDINSPETWGEHDGFISYADYPEEPALGEFAKRRIKMLHPNNYEEALANALSDIPRGRQVFSAIPRYSNQIKSADPATYNGKGEVIPLSERFNPEGNDIRFSFIGEKGARGIDEALFGLGEDGRKMDDLEVAKKMEEEGKDAKAIKLATGWERGVDKLWRYEISTPHFKSVSAASFDLNESKKLGDIISDGEIFRAYPQLRDIEVSAVKLPNDTYGQYGSGAIELNAAHLPKKDGKYAIFSVESVRTLHHELQHAIQKIEGFASRSTSNITSEDLMKAVKNNENAYTFAQLFGSNPLNRMLAQNPARLADMIRRDSPRFNGDLKARVPSLIQALEGMSQDEYSILVRSAKNGIKSARAYATKNYFKSANEVESRNVEARLFMTDQERRNSLAMETEDVPREEQIVLYSKVTDPDLIKKLDSEPVEEWYGSMTWLNPEETDKSKWKFAPVKSAKDSKGQLREASSIDQWEQSEEDLEGLKSGKYDLKDVDNDVVGGVNYNPYFHVSNSLMNDQFTGAYNKPNTVVVKFLVPKSELYPEGEAYHAEGAKNHVGVLPWHSGTINAKLPADKQRSVALTRWRKPIGIASNEEVAKFIATKLKEANTSMPWNLVTPGVLAELDKIGAPISEGAGSAKMKGAPRPNVQFSKLSSDGLRKLSDKVNSEAYDKFAGDVFFTDEDARKSIINLAKGMDWDFLKASKEYLASLADVWEPSESDRKIYDKVRELYDKPLTDEEARYLMWRKGNREKGAFGVAEDIVMQKNLEVGDFKNDGVQFSKFSIFGNNGKRSQQNSDGRSEGIIRSAVAGDPARKLAIRRDLGDIQGYRDGLAARSSEYSLLDSQIEKERFVSETLVNRAKEAGQYIAWDKAEEMGLPFKGKTMESLVMKDGNRVVKLKDPFAASAIKGNEPIDAIIEHVVHNILFPNTPYKFLGITEDYKGDMRFVLEQPFIKSIEEADQNDVVDFLENNLGLRDEGREQYGNNFVSVIDAFGENVLIDEDGELNFIDPIIKLTGNGDGVIKELLGEDNTMFSKSVGQAADRYNEAVRVINKKGEKKATANLFWRMNEAYLDSMKALKELQNAIADETGKPIKDFENAYIAENAMSSKNQAGADEFQANYMTRILDALKDLYRVGRTQKDIVEYLIAKHGLERNEIFQQREEAKLRKELGEKLSQLDETADGYQQRHDELIYEYEQKILNTHRDYSGLTDLTGSKDDYTERARRIVGIFEGTNPEGAARLWRAINAATKRTLEINYEAGLMDKEAYENLRGMFKYYIPLRGWDSDVASHEYNYLGGDGPLREKTIKTAEGRTSVSDDPIATINKMAYDAIALANRNLMKQKLLNLAENHPTKLLRVSEQWYTKNAATGEWEGVSPDIPEDATGEEITRIIDEFESRMKQAEADGNAKRQRNGLTLSKHATGFEKKEHEVRVRRAGKEYVIYVNGNPRAAQAVNGLTNPSNDPSVIKQGLQNIKNLMAQAFTSKNPAFIFANLSRDSLFAASSVFAKESGSYTALYVRNYARNLKKMTGLVRKLNNGTLDESLHIERYFHEFVKNGGETGYTNIVTVDSYKKKLKRLEKEIRNGAAGQLPKKAWDGIWDGVEFLNRSAEDVTRFAVYMTSRTMGRSVARSVYDAKEVTVNFNKKGSGGYLAQQMNFAYIFFNACVQSAANLGRLIKSHPGKMGAIFGTYLAGGMLQPMLIAALQEALGHGDDDDDKSYWDLPEWVRRNNLIFWVPFTNMYINIPLPQELRPLFGIGEIAASVAFEKENINDGIAKGAEGLSGIMPIDLTGNGGNMAINFTPTALQPVAQLIANKDFFGVPIYKKNEFNKENPDWTKAYKGTSSVLVNGTKWLSNMTGGDNVVKGNVDLNPAIIEHLFEGYLGGLGKTLNKSAKSIMMLAGNEDWNMRNVPIASSFVQVPDERNTGSQTNREYYNLLDEYKEAQHKYNGYVNQLKREGGIYWDEYAKKIDEYTNTEDYARYMKMKPYVNAIDMLNTKKKNLPQDMVEEVDKQIADLKKEMISKMKGNE